VTVSEPVESVDALETALNFYYSAKPGCTINTDPPWPGTLQMCADELPNSLGYNTFKITKIVAGDDTFDESGTIVLHVRESNGVARWVKAVAYVHHDDKDASVGEMIYDDMAWPVEYTAYWQPSGVAGNIKLGPITVYRHLNAF
jgi:hypothetical protein